MNTAGQNKQTSAAEATALLSRVFLVFAIAFGTAILTCLTALPNASDKPELVDLYVMVLRFSSSGLISAFVWYVPLVVRLRMTGGTPWSIGGRWILSALSILGAMSLVLIFFRIITNGIELVGPIAARYGTGP